MRKSIAILASLAFLLGSFVPYPAFADYQNANCRQEVYPVTQGVPSLRVTACIYLINNNSWINAVVSWNNVACSSYIYSSKSYDTDAIKFLVARNIPHNGEQHVYYKEILHTCGHSGTVSWQGPATDADSFSHYKVGYFTEAEAKAENDEAYYFSSPKVYAHTRASRFTPKKTLNNKPVKIHGFGNYQ